MERQSNPDEGDNIMELEHAIGYSGRVNRSVYLHPNGKDFVYISGGCIVICDLNDPHQQSFLRAHDDQVTCLAVSNTGALLASGQKGDNSDVIIWDFESKQPKFKLAEHDHVVVCVEFSHDDKLLFSCGNAQDKKIFIWDTSNGYIVASSHMIPEPISCARWGGYVKDIKGRDTYKYQLATAGNKQICIWKLDAKSGQLERDVINTGSTIRDYICMDFSKNKEDYLYVGTTSGDFCIFQMKNMVLSAIVNVCAQGVTSIQGVTSNLIATGGGNGSLTFFKIDGAQAIAINKQTLTGAVNSLSVSPEKAQVLATTDRGFMFRVLTNNFEKFLHCENHTENVLFIAYPKGVSDKFLSCSEDQTIRLWDVSDYVVEQRIAAAGGGAPLCAIYSDEVVLSGWEDNRIRMNKVEDGSKIWQIENAHKGGVTSLCIAKNFKFICSGGNEGECRIWELRSREMISHLKEHTSRICKVMLWEDDMHVLTASRDKALLFWDLKTEKRVSAHVQRMGGINSFDIVPNTNLVLSTGQDRRITYWDLRQPNPIKSIETNNNPKKGDECYSIAISHNGKMFATGGSEQVVRLWDLSSGKMISEGDGHSGTINSVAFSDDDKQLLSGGKDGSIFLWNIYAQLVQSIHSIEYTLNE